MKTINFNATIYALCKQHPELIAILDEAGFHDITKPFALETFGRLMDLSKGAMLKGLDMAQILKTLEAHGFTVSYDNPFFATLAKIKVAVKDKDTIALSQLVNTLTFQELEGLETQCMKEGMAQSDISLIKSLYQKENDLGTLVPSILEEGHPLQVLYEENVALSQHLDAVKATPYDLEHLDQLKSGVGKLLGVYAHYMKKDELLYPLLTDKGYPRVNDVMWHVEDVIKKNLSKFNKTVNETNLMDKKKDFDDALIRMQDLIQKENTILFPLCEATFTNEEWQAVHQDFARLGYSFITPKPWAKAKPQQATPSKADGSIVLPTGEFELSQLEAVLRTLPAELTYIDKDDTVRFFSDVKEHIFKRPLLCLGRNVYQCHSPLIKPIVKKVVSDLKAGTKDEVKILREIKGRKILVRYMAVRSKDGEYLGCLEAVEDLSEYIKA